MRNKKRFGWSFEFSPEIKNRCHFLNNEESVKPLSRPVIDNTACNIFR